MKSAFPLLSVAPAEGAANLLAQVQKGGVDSVVVLSRRRLKVRPAQLGCQGLALVSIHLAGTQEVALIAHQDHGDVARGVDAAHMLVERLYGVVAAEVCDGEGQHVAVRPVDGAVDLLLAVQTLRVILYQHQVMRDEYIEEKELKGRYMRHLEPPVQMKKLSLIDTTVHE